MLSEELKSCSVLVDFLSFKDPKSFSKNIKQLEKLKPPSSLEELGTFSGKHELSIDHEYFKFGNKIETYASSYEVLYGR